MTMSDNRGPVQVTGQSTQYFEPIAKASTKPGLAAIAMGFYRRLFRIERLATTQQLDADTVAGAEALSVHFSLKHHGLDPCRYCATILPEVAHCQTVADYEALLPWHIELAPQSRGINGG